jgi:hypothetical protein
MYISKNKLGIHMIKLLSKASLFFGAVALSASAGATVITMNLTTGINGSTPYATDKMPWLTATFTDMAAQNGQNVVQLVLTNNLVNASTGQPTGEFVTDWLFNIDPTISGLSYSWVSGFKANVLYEQTNGGNSIKAGIFDIDFAGGTANTDRFNGGMSSVYSFSAANLSANSFAFTSNEGYYTAADVKGIGNGLSGSIGTKTLGNTKPPAAVPEPGSIMLLGAGLAGVVFARRRKQGKQAR